VTSTRSTGWRRRAALSLLGAAAVTTAMITAAPSAGAAPGPDEIDHSDNMSLLANLPTGFDPALSVGTDIAFTDGLAIAGNYLGFTIYDVRDPKRPTVVSQVLCPGAQNDVSVQGDLLFLSTDSRRSDNSCNSTSQSDGTKPYWEGIKIFDISDKRNPRYIKSVETDCGSHTHTLVPDKSGEDVYLYVSSYSPSATLSKCQPPHDKISIVKVPLDDPTSASVIAAPVIFPDGGNPGVPGNVEDGYVSATTGCHDITVYPAKDMAAGACMGDGVLFDISDREAPRVISTVRDNEHFAFWHSATFNNEGTKVIFTDELGGGGAATCNAAIGPNRGADGIYDLTGQGDSRRLEFRSYYKIGREQTDEENCVAHNGSLIPVRGRDIMVQSWYMGGVSVWDFTDSRHPVELGYWDRGPASNPDESGGTWSAYYYNGHIFSSDLGKGFDVLEIEDPRTNQAKSVRFDVLNVQTQGHYGH